MSDLIKIIYDHLMSDDSVFDVTPELALEAAQAIAEAIVATGWPRS